MKKRSAFPGRVFFDHIPKTAGTAITSWLQAELGSGCVSPQIDGSHRNMIRRYGGIYSVLSGHTDYDAGELLDPRYTYITCFRDPVDRALSWLYYAINDFEPIDNRQVREWANDFIESDGQLLADELIPSISNIYVTHFSNIGIQGKESLRNKSVEYCLEVLSQFDIVGFQEDISAFSKDISELLNFKDTSGVRGNRVNQSRPSVSLASVGLRSRIIELNQLDIRLYEEIKELRASWRRQRVSKLAGGVLPNWERYERQGLDRYLSNPDLIIAKIELKEGLNIEHGQVMSFEVDFLLAREVIELAAGIHIHDSEKRLAFGTNSALLRRHYGNLAQGSYRVMYHLIANLPAGIYTAGIAFSEKLPDGYRELAWRDISCEFRVLQQVDQDFVGYSYLPAEITVIPSPLAKEDLTIAMPIGHVIVATPIASILPGDHVSLLVEISNHGSQIWLGDIFRPVRLCYRWLDSEGYKQIAEGVRSVLPEGGVPSGGTVRAQMKVISPRLPGEYVLIVTLLQENVGWFENLCQGFRPASIRVVVGTNEEEAQEPLRGTKNTETSVVALPALPVLGVETKSALAARKVIRGKNKVQMSRKKH